MIEPLKKIDNCTGYRGGSIEFGDKINEIIEVVNLLGRRIAELQDIPKGTGISPVDKIDQIVSNKDLGKLATAIHLRLKGEK